jgi:hypothetical protein
MKVDSQAEECKDEKEEEGNEDDEGQGGDEEDDVQDAIGDGDEEDDTRHDVHRSGKPVMTAKGLVDFKAWDDEAFQKVKSFYGFSDALTLDSFFVREDYCNTKESGVSAKFVYFMPSSARDLMAADKDGRIKIVCAGIKVLEKKVNKGNGDVDYRLIQEGVGVLLPFITKRKITVTIQVDYIIIVINRR